ncbi:hypothetical protein DHEL01_v209766 [Diaporthe helianthi]|uniref:Uncharacterized protein n=1 Tax=Diaporthe helianthi TaxID=158607 RepID=A0A2P5HNL0_DIAHE|nr:hypothetical protein DHEL01_v209766 [Diaporthe helianthi]
MTTTNTHDTSSSSRSPSTGANTTSTAATSVAPSIPKELVEQYTLIVSPKPGASLEKIEKMIRSRIESPCGNVVWGSSQTRKPTGSSDGGGGGGGGCGGVLTLLMEVIYHNCSRQGPIPRVCHRMHIINGRGALQPHEPLTMEAVVLLVGCGLPTLVASCEVVAERSWAVNAISTLE